MPLSGWVLFIICAIGIGITGFYIYIMSDENSMTIIATFACILLVFCGMNWYYTNTASGQRAVVDERSNLSGGIQREINVYTANGDLIAHYEGKIDIETNDGGYIKFDFQGKRYIYYNCFVETIAEIG